MSGHGAVRIGFAVLAVVFFAGPFAVRLVGVTPEAFENRRLAEAPKASQGWDGFQQASRYIVDRLPLRAEAVRANSRIWTDVFGTDPPYVRDEDSGGDRALPFAGAIEDAGERKVGASGNGPQAPAAARSGLGDWLFFDDEFRLACDERPSNTALLRRWASLVRALRRSGREAAMFVAPVKSSVYPEHLPDEYPFDHCALAAKARLWRTLARDGPAVGVHGLRADLLRRKANAGDGLFQQSDTHWTTLGALSATTVVLEQLGGGVELLDDEVVTRGSQSYTGDLSRAGGDPTTDRRDEYGIERAPGAPRVPGRTLLLCDSFFYLWFRLFKPYFEDVRYVSWYDAPDRIRREVRKADRVILEGNELVFKTEAEAGRQPDLLTRMLATGSARAAQPPGA